MTQEHTATRFPFPDPPTLYHPAPEVAELARTRPVSQVTFPDGRTAWLVTRYADVRTVLIDPRFSRAAASSPDVPQPGLSTLLDGSLMSMDPPEHSRLRRLVARAFTAHRVEQLRPTVAALVDELLDGVLSQPQPVDLIEHFSLPLPVRVICDLLGVPASDQHLFHGWSDAAMGGWENDQERVGDAVRHLSAYFADLIAVKRAKPADDLLTALIAARDEQDRLSEEELVSLAFGLLIGGHETTANQINMFLVTLLHFPEELARLRAEPETIPQAVEELMRFVQLGPDAVGLPRVAVADVELSGVMIPAGSTVLPAIGTANRDPETFDGPNRLDLSRHTAHHLSFGAGAHHCLGAQLARMELQEALGGILRRLPGLRIAVPDEQLRFKAGMLLRSMECLPVAWDPTPAAEAAAGLAARAAAGTAAKTPDGSAAKTPAGTAAKTPDGSAVESAAGTTAGPAAARPGALSR